LTNPSGRPTNASTDTALLFVGIPDLYLLILGGDFVRCASAYMWIASITSPAIQIVPCGGNRSFRVKLATHIFHAVANLLLVNVQSDVLHGFHGGASLVF
jgi:hypothetical protein